MLARGKGLTDVAQEVRSCEERGKGEGRADHRFSWSARGTFRSSYGFGDGITPGGSPLSQHGEGGGAKLRVSPQQCL